MTKTKVSPATVVEDEEEYKPTSLTVNDQPTSLATIDVESMMEQDAGTGMEGVDKDSFAIPFLTALQGLSPAMERLDGAKLGLLHNTVTDELMKEAIVIPCAFERKFLQWAPRSEGGGFRGELTPYEVEDLRRRDELDENENGEIIYNGNILKDTRVHYVLLYSAIEDTYTPAVMSLSSTQIKYSKRWISTMQSKKSVNRQTGTSIILPSFAFTYVVKTQKEENNKGSWYSFNITANDKVTDADLYLQAKKLNADITAGIVKMAPPEDDTTYHGENQRF